MSDILAGTVPNRNAGNREFRKQRASRYNDKHTNEDQIEFSMNWLPQKRQLKFLKACGLSHPFNYYLHEKEDGTPKIYRIAPDKRKKAYEAPEARIVGYGGAAGGGKGQPESGLVVTPYGFREMKDISVGDIICSPTHGNTEVIYKYDLGKTDIYEVEFADNTSLEVTSEHIWKVAKVRGGKNKKGLRYFLITTEQIKYNLVNGYYDLQIPLPEAIQFTKSYRYNYRNIDPYVLGCLIGDGSIASGRVKIHSGDKEVHNYFKNEFGDNYSNYGTGEGTVSNKTKVKENLKKLKLWGKKSEDKFIPDQYLYWSIEKRFELAQGLMDTDGTVDERGHLSYCTVSKQLAEDVTELIRGLGYRVTMSEAQASYCNGEQKRDKYRLYIQGNRKDELFKLTRKKNRCVERGFPTHKKITDVKYKRKEQAYCLKVSNPNGLYIAGKDYILTHNSDAMLVGLFIEVLSNPGAKCGYFRRTFAQLEGPGGAIMRSKELFSDFPGAVWNGSKRRWTFESLNGGIIQFCHANNEDDVYNYQSQQFDAIAFDEATQFTRFQYRYIMSRNRVTVKGVAPLVMMGTNPGGVGHIWFKNEFVEPGAFEEVHKVEVSPGVKEKHMFIPAKLSDNIILNDRDEGYEANLMGLNEIERKRLLEGDWDIHSGQFFPRFSRDIHVIDSFEIPQYWKRFISIDYGLDMSAVYWYALDNHGFYYVYKELYRPNLSLSDLAIAIHKKTTPLERDVLSYTIASPDLWNRRQETGKSGRQILTENGLSGYALRAADNRRVPGWRVVREYLKPIDDPFHDGEGEAAKVARIRIFGDRVRKLQSNLPALQHDDTDPDDVSDTPHNITHAPESFRYFCMSRPPLKSLTQTEENQIKRRRAEIMAGRNKYTGY